MQRASLSPVVAEQGSARPVWYVPNASADRELDDDRPVEGVDVDSLLPALGGCAVGQALQVI